ncbi:MAG: hypothetical protein JRF29_04285 [Deltaproteobacteria bacterium]|jgi:hypothetical protein|nr:hypothetical protein [Deltaproteobacteria bacterium]
MSNWIPFLEGEYAVEQAFIVAPDDSAMAVEDASIEVFQDSGGQRRLKGSGRIRNILLVELLEDSDDLDLVLDLGDEFKYRLKKPKLQSGKFFSPDAKSTLHFRPAAPWEQIPQTDFENLISRFNVISD